MAAGFNDRDTDAYDPSTSLYAQVPGLGETLHGYTLERELGRGGHGVVFLGRGPRGEQIALKVLWKLGGQQLERLRREALALSQLSHPGIVGLREAFTDGEQPVLILDYVAGETLALILKDPTVALEAKLDLLAQVGRAVHYAHQHRVVHRDLKPTNVLVCEGVAKVMDFGHAIDLDRETRLTETRASVGTPLYMAPEQVRQGKNRVGPSADVYSLGVMLYEVLTGSVPHGGRSSLAEQQEDLLTRIPDPPSQLNTSLGPNHDRVCLRALAKSPAKRQPTALALARDIELLRFGEELPSPGGGAPRVLWSLLPWVLTVAASLGWAFSPEPAAAPADLPDPTPTRAQTKVTPGGSERSIPKLVSLEEIPRLTREQLRLGTYVTARRNQQWRVALIVGDSGDAGYDLLFLDGQSATGEQSSGFFPDVFMPGAECRADPETRYELSGVVVERRGGAVLVETRDERIWLSLGHVWLEAGQRVPLEPAPFGTARLVNALYGSKFYPAVELEQEAGRSLVMYLSDAEVEWRSPLQLAPLPGPGAKVEFRPSGSNRAVTATVIERQNEALLVQRASGGKEWLSLSQVHVKK